MTGSGGGEAEREPHENESQSRQFIKGPERAAADGGLSNTKVEALLNDSLDKAVGPRWPPDAERDH